MPVHRPIRGGNPMTVERPQPCLSLSDDIHLRISRVKRGRDAANLIPRGPLHYVACNGFQSAETRRSSGSKGYCRATLRAIDLRPSMRNLRSMPPTRAGAARVVAAKGGPFE
jgi:hypothetical protein